MAKTVKQSNTTLTAVEKYFGPVLPGSHVPERTISVFQEYTSPKKYKLFGRLGIVNGAIWHLHTQVPIIPSKIKGHITGILEEGKQNDPNRRQLAADWLSDYLAAEALKKAEATQKAAAAEAKKTAAANAKHQKEQAAEHERQRKADIAKKAAARAGEYNAQLTIGGSLNTTFQIRVKVDTKGKVTLVVPKRLQLPPPI